MRGLLRGQRVLTEAREYSQRPDPVYRAPLRDAVISHDEHGTLVAAAAGVEALLRRHRLMREKTWVSASRLSDGVMPTASGSAAHTHTLKNKNK